MAAIVVNGSGKLVVGTNGFSPDGCTELNPFGTATWSATAIPWKPISSAARAMSQSWLLSSNIRQSQCFIAIPLVVSDPVAPRAADRRHREVQCALAHEHFILGMR